MQQSIKFRFLYEGSLSSKDKSDTTTFINRTIFEAEAYFTSKGMEGDIDFIEFVQEKYLQPKRKEIEFFLCADALQIHEFSRAEFPKIELEKDGNIYIWSFMYGIQSDIYTLINILPDKTVVCFKHDLKEVEFVNVAGLNLKMVVED